MFGGCVFYNFIYPWPGWIFFLQSYQCSCWFTQGIYAQVNSCVRIYLTRLVYSYCSPFKSCTQLMNISDLYCFHLSPTEYLRFITREDYFLRRVERWFMMKPSNMPYYFATHMIMMDLFKLWWLTSKDISFWCFSSLIALITLHKSLTILFWKCFSFGYHFAIICR